MKPERLEFEEIARVLPEPTLIVSGEGIIYSANPAAHRLTGAAASHLHGRSLLEQVSDPAERVAAYLAACSRSRQMVLGSLTWRKEGQDAEVYRCEGCVVRPWSPNVPDAPALILLRLRPKESAVARFILLNNKILDLNKEIEARRRTEAALQEREIELRALNAHLEDKVRERTGELEITNEELHRRNRELQDFAYAASHDLQEPLRKIRTFASLLRDDYGEHLDEEGVAYLHKMEDAAGRMSRLIIAILALSRITTSGLPFQEVDLNAVAAQALSDLEVSIESTGGQVNVEPLPVIHADPVQMHQLLQNLIGNALKYRREEVPPVVRVSVATSDTASEQTRRLQLIVRDNGIGFDEKYLDRIFNPFQRLHARSEYEGTGMGLAICRRIAERHGGTITARSTPGQGSTFIVTLPR